MESLDAVGNRKFIHTALESRLKKLGLSRPR
jgi:hypothetical protein